MVSKANNTRYNKKRSIKRNDKLAQLNITEKLIVVKELN